MFEEEKQDDEFSDLPGEDPIEEEEKEKEEDPKTEPEEKKPEVPAGDDKDKKYQKILADKDRALKESRKKEKELERQLNEAKGAKEEPKSDPVDPKKVADDVLAQVEAKKYGAEITAEIKAVYGITQAEARELKEIIDKLPKTGSAKIDVAAARSYLRGVRGEDFSAPQSPTGMGFGAFPREQAAAGEPSARQKDYGKQYGKLTDEDYKNYNGVSPKL